MEHNRWCACMESPEADHSDTLCGCRDVRPTDALPIDGGYWFEKSKTADPAMRFMLSACYHMGSQIEGHRRRWSRGRVCMHAKGKSRERGGAHWMEHVIVLMITWTLIVGETLAEVDGVVFDAQRRHHAEDGVRQLSKHLV